MASDYGKIYESTWWGVGVENNISWGIVYADLAGNEVGTIVTAFVDRVVADGGTVENPDCLKDEVKYLISNPAAPSGYTGLLDTYSGAAAAYSLRLLDTSYTGDAIVVRRASDNTTQNIGFVNNELDTASLESFCSGTDGFVTTWYDQSGNGNDAVNATASSQPKIVSSGSTITEGTKPVLSFNGTSNRLVAPDSDTLSFTDGAGNDTPMNVFMAYHNNATSNSIILGKDDGAPNREYALGYFDSDLRFYIKENGGNTQLSKDNKDAGQLDYLLMSAFYDGSENVNGFTMFKNGIASTLGDVVGSTISGMANTSANLYIGTYIDNPSFCFDGTLQEIVMYGSNQTSNRTGIETNINDHYSIY